MRPLAPRKASVLPTSCRWRCNHAGARTRRCHGPTSVVKFRGSMALRQSVSDGWALLPGPFITLRGSITASSLVARQSMKTAICIRRPSRESSSSAGEVLWRYDPPGLDNNEVALLGPAVLGTTRNGKAWAVDRHTGKELWVTKLANDAGADCGYPAGYDGIFVAAAKAGTDPRMQGGNMQVFGLNATTGGILWEYDVDLPTWNFAPLFPGDGSFVFMDFAGGTYRVDLYNGTEIWKTLPTDSRQSFSDGGATLGPNQMVYTCSNFGESLGAKGTNSTGIVRAFGLKAGDLVWQRRTDSPCNSWPAVGSLTGVYSLAVVVTPGAFVGQPDLDASILALNAETGEDIWNVVLTGYTGPAPFFQAAGDTEGILPRLIDGIQPLCLPAHFSAPNIDRNGVVYVGRCDGNLYVIYGPQSVVRDVQPGMLVDNASGMVGEMFNLGSAPLHGAMGFAPGMFAYSTCDTLHVFNPPEV